MYRSRRSKQTGISTAWLAVFLAVALGAAWLLFFRAGAPFPMSRQPASDPAPAATSVDDARVVRALREEPGSWLTYGRTF